MKIEKTENDDSNDLNDEKVVRIKLYNFDNGYFVNRSCLVI